MENSYGIGVTNRYALFYDDTEDHNDILKQQEERVIERISSGKRRKKDKNLVTIRNRLWRKNHLLLPRKRKCPQRNQ